MIIHFLPFVVAAPAVVTLLVAVTQVGSLTGSTLSHAAGAHEQTAWARESLPVQRGGAEDMADGSLACPTVEQLAPFWPPQGTVGERVKGAPWTEADLQRIPFEGVRVIAIACGEVRGTGQDAYLAYQLPQGQARDQTFGPIFLAALHQAEGALINLGALPVSDNPHAGVGLHDVTTDGRAEILFVAGTGAFTAASFSIWEADRYRELFSGGGDYPPLFRDVDGDGRVEIILANRVIFTGVRGDLLGDSQAESFPWPTAYRWDGHRRRHQERGTPSSDTWASFPV